jgi:hypothetical protein
MTARIRLVPLRVSLDGIPRHAAATPTSHAAIAAAESATAGTAQGPAGASGRNSAP